MIELECGRCHKRYTPGTLETTLLCCTTRRGVTRLIAEVEDPETGRRWFTVAGHATVRFIVNQGQRTTQDLPRKDGNAK